MRSLAWLLVVAACSKGGDDKRQSADRKPEMCKAWSAKIAARLAPSAAKKNPLAPYVEPELIAHLSKGLEGICTKMLPVAHIHCVLLSKDATEADQCPFDVDSATAQGFPEEMKRVVVEGIEHSMTFAASAAECAEAGAAMAKEMAAAAPDTKTPDGPAFAALCERDTWDAAFVRCYNARHDTHECRSQSKVQAGIRALVGAPPP